MWFCCSDFYTVCILHIITSVRLSNLRLSTTEYKDTWRLWQIEQQQLIAKYLYTNTLWQCLMGPMILYVFVIAIQHEPYGNMKTYYKNTIYLFFSFSDFFFSAVTFECFLYAIFALFVCWLTWQYCVYSFIMVSVLFSAVSHYIIFIKSLPIQSRRLLCKMGYKWNKIAITITIFWMNTRYLNRSHCKEIWF